MPEEEPKLYTLTDLQKILKNQSDTLRSMYQVKRVMSINTNEDFKVLNIDYVVEDIDGVIVFVRE